MELKFKKPITPNFVHTDKGWFSINVLTEKELMDFIELWSETLASKYHERKNEK